MKFIVFRPKIWAWKEVQEKRRKFSRAHNNLLIFQFVFLACSIPFLLWIEITTRSDFISSRCCLISCIAARDEICKKKRKKILFVLFETFRRRRVRNFLSHPGKCATFALLLSSFISVSLESVNWGKFHICQLEDDDDGDRNPRHHYSSPTAHVQTIFGGTVMTESKREHKALRQKCLKVCSADERLSDPRLPPWSHREITFSRQDRWAAIPEPGRFPLVVDPCINKVHFERVLVDGGSSINLLFRNSLKHLKLTTSDLLPYQAQFWGVLPG